jgi:hypothetical protein
VSDVARSTKDHEHDGWYRVYILEAAPELAQQLPKIRLFIQSGQRCFYVGETGKPVRDRIAEHRTGKPHGAGAKKVKKCQLSDGLRRLVGRPLTAEELAYRKKASSRYPAVATRDEVLGLEKQAVDDLRAQGHIVYPEGGGTGAYPFKQEAAP